MPVLRPIVWFFCKTSAIYVAFLVFHGESAYASVFRGFGNAVYARMGEGGRVRLNKVPEKTAQYDTQVTLRNARSGARATMEISTRTIGYLPTAFTVALALATPIPFKRRAIALALGLVLISCFVGLQFYLRFVEVLSDLNPLNAYRLGPFLKQSIRVLIKVLSLTPVTSYIVPVTIWVVVVFRRDQLAHLVAQCRGERPERA